MILNPQTNKPLTPSKTPTYLGQILVLAVVLMSACATSPESTDKIQTTPQDSVKSSQTTKKKNRSQTSTQYEAKDGSLIPIGSTVPTDLEGKHILKIDGVILGDTAYRAPGFYVSPFGLTVALENDKNKTEKLKILGDVPTKTVRRGWSTWEVIGVGATVFLVAGASGFIWGSVK